MAHSLTAAATVPFTNDALAVDGVWTAGDNAEYVPFSESLVKKLEVSAGRLR